MLLKSLFNRQCTNELGCVLPYQQKRTTISFLMAYQIYCTNILLCVDTKIYKGVFFSYINSNSAKILSIIFNYPSIITLIKYSIRDHKDR